VSGDRDTIFSGADPGGPADGFDAPEIFDPTTKIGDLAAAAGIRRVEMLAWRDLDHPEAGGSEIHAARIAERWAAAGIEVRLVASRAPGAPSRHVRDGYSVSRPAGRYGIFPRAAAGGMAGGVRSRRWADATVEIWNGMPFFSPLWAPRPRAVFLHHVHDGMWDLVMPSGLARVGRFIEARLAPPFYRSTPVVTLSESSRRSIVDVLGLPEAMVRVVHPGVDEQFCPGPRRDPTPLVVAVGRLVSYKRFDRLIEVLAELRHRHPTLRAVIAGEGSERRSLEDLAARLGASDWLTMPGRVDEDDLIDLYQRAWAVASTSAFEGWGLTITEAAACATPAVASPIAGHRDALHDGVTGFLAEPGAEMVDGLDRILSDARLRERMQGASRRWADSLTWDRTALATFRSLTDQMLL
jgi:glycosyltransferase involved in cell wall biosynthesis